MTTKTTARRPADGDQAEAPASVTGLLAALHENVEAFRATQADLISRATQEATKAGEEFAKLAQRPDAGEFEDLKKRADQQELDLSTARLQVKELTTELETAGKGLQELRDAKNRAEEDLAAANVTIAELQAEAATDKALIRGFRSRTEALAATFAAAQDALSMPDLDELAADAPEATPAEPGQLTPVQPAAEFDFTSDPADGALPESEPEPEPAAVTEFADPVAADEDDPFNPVRSIGTFRPVALPDAGFNPPAPQEELAAAAQTSDEAASGLDLPDLDEPETPAGEQPAPAAGEGLELPDLELGDLDLPAAAAAPAGFDLPDLEEPEATGHDGAKDGEASGFELLELPDLEPAPAR